MPPEFENMNCGRSVREEHALSASTTASTPLNDTVPQSVDVPISNLNVEESLEDIDKMCIYIRFLLETTRLSWHYNTQILVRAAIALLGCQLFCYLLNRPIYSLCIPYQNLQCQCPLYNHHQNSVKGE